MKLWGLSISDNARRVGMSDAELRAAYAPAEQPPFMHEGNWVVVVSPLDLWFSTEHARLLAVPVGELERCLVKRQLLIDVRDGVSVFHQSGISESDALLAIAAINDVSAGTIRKWYRTIVHEGFVGLIDKRKWHFPFGDIISLGAWTHFYRVRAMWPTLGLQAYRVIVQKISDDRSLGWIVPVADMLMEGSVYSECLGGIV